MDDRTTAGPGAPPGTGAAAGDAARLRGLRRMKTLATGLLLLVTLGYALSTWAEHSGAGGWAGYLAAAFEAGMVGALADWFAVTALFRHPLGLPVPHTAIIPTKKDQLGQSLGDFVGENFLAAEVVRDRLRSVALAERLGRWLSQPANADRVTAELATALRGGLAVLRDADVQAVLGEALTRRAEQAEISPVLGRLLERTVTGGGHHRVVDLLCAQAHEWLEKHRDAVLSAVEDGAPGWTPRFVDRRVGERVYRELLRFTAEMRDSPEHPARAALDRFLTDFAGQLQHDPETRARVERLKGEFLHRPEVQELIAAAWANARAMILAAAEDESSALRRRAHRAILGVGDRLTADAGLRDKLDGWVIDAALHVVSGYRDEITALITDTVASWDARTTSRRIELHIGRDLQFIRINGTVIGSLAGLLIHTATRVAGG